MKRLEDHEKVKNKDDDYTKFYESVRDIDGRYTIEEMKFDDDCDDLELDSIHDDEEKANNNRKTTFQNDLSGWYSGSKIKQLIESKKIMKEDITKFKEGTNIKDNNVYSLDLNKCRRNIMLHNKEDYPVFTVLDKVEPYVETDEIQPGIYFVETKNYFPLRGNRFYHHTMIKYALEQNIISHTDIKFQIISSLTLKSDYFNKFIEHISNKLSDEKTLLKLAQFKLRYLYEEIPLNNIFPCSNAECRRKLYLRIRTICHWHGVC